MSEPKNINDVINITKLSLSKLPKETQQKRRTDMIQYALKHRTFLIFPNERRLIACAPEGIIDFGKDDISDIIKTIALIQENFINYAADDGIKDPERVYHYIEAASELDASYIGEFSKEVNSAIDDMLSNLLIHYDTDKDPKVKETIEEGVKLFYERSKAYIPENNFKTGDFVINPREEKTGVRNEFIATLMKFRLGNCEFYNSLGFFKDLNQEDIVAILNAGIITQEDFRKVITNKFNLKSAEEYYDMLTRLGKVNKEYLSSFTTEELIGLALDGKINKKVFTRMKFSPKYIASLPLDKLSKLVGNVSLSTNVGMTETKNDNGKTSVYLKNDFVKSLKGFKLVELLKENSFKLNMSKQELFDQYLETLSGTDVIELAKLGYIDERDVIKINFIRTGNPFKDNLMLGDILDFYDAERLQKMTGDKKLSSKFVEDFNDTLRLAPPEQSRKYVAGLLGSKLESLQRDELLAELSIRGCFDDIDLNGYKISPKNIEQLFLEDRIKEEDMVKLASKNVISMDTLSEFLTDEEITEYIMSGKLPLDAVSMARNDDDVILNLLDGGKISPKQLGHIYSTKEDMTAETFLELLEYIDEAKEQDISKLLDDDISKEKIQDLFSKFYISHDELSDLVGRKIITQVEADRYALELEKHNNFNSLFKQGSSSIKLIRKNEYEGRRDDYTRELGPVQTPSRKGDKIDFDLKEKLLFAMGASENVLELVGKKNSLDGYRVYGFEDLGSMVFMSPEPDNATFVMSLAQGLYFIKNFERENGDGLSQVISTATKRALRNSEHIDVRNASKKWGKNMVRSIERKGASLKPRTTEYMRKINGICKEIEDDYISRQ